MATMIFESDISFPTRNLSSKAGNEVLLKKSRSKTQKVKCHKTSHSIRISKKFNSPVYLEYGFETIFNTIKCQLVLTLS